MATKVESRNAKSKAFVVYASSMQRRPTKAQQARVENGESPAFAPYREAGVATQTTAKFDSVIEMTIKAKAGIQGVVASRCSRVIDFLLALPEDVLVEAAKESSDIGVVTYLLSRPEMVAVPVTPDPLAGARLRGIAIKSALLQAEGGSKTTAEVAALLGVSPQAITKRRHEGKLIAVELGTKGFHYPVWQFDLPGFDGVLKVMRERDGWDKINFFLNPNDALQGKRPLDALRRKQIPVALVVEAAKGYGEAGA
ncbi:MAG: helix-turn-helix domain-containing protein [Acidobacteria bacterium]|nr:helix-turn-helix domain-containing protein [Acidobacteriota bacterium]